MSIRQRAGHEGFATTEGYIRRAEVFVVGFGEPFPVSAIHGEGTGDLLDAIVERLPPEGDAEEPHTELALALTVFNVVSGVLQTPVGFLVDRVGARVVLIAGLALSSAAYAAAGIFPS